MKTAIYQEDGVIQIVLTPENDFEKNALDTIGDNEATAELKQGSFYECQGGFIRQKGNFESLDRSGYGSSDTSLIVYASKK